MSGAWCNSDTATSSLMEAISFVTPVLENYFIRTVGDGVAGLAQSELKTRCRAFIREESAHSRSHKKFNASLLDYLGRMPPGLVLVEALLDSSAKWLSQPNRLMLAAALEHFAAVLSKGYMEQEGTLQFGSAYARAMFMQHAVEELAHRSVVYDLWLSKGAAHGIWRSLTVLAILLAGSGYMAIATSWIFYRKRGRKIVGTLAELAGFAAGRFFKLNTYAAMPELFLFVRRTYHPDQLVESKEGSR